ncbi:MAG: alpha/beta hydrolase-fold protein [Tetrasphaera sp.]
MLTEPEASTPRTSRAKKIRKRVLMTLLVIVGVIAILIAALFGFMTYKNTHYYDFVKTGGPIETKYTPMGSLDVTHVSVSDGGDKFGQQQVWYPTELEKSDKSYPVVIIANGTGSIASTIEPVLEHLASWGFIVVGNDDENSRTGESSEASLNFILGSNDDAKSIFKGHVDVDHIGIAGHSQGGVGAINAATKQPSAKRYSALFLASPTGEYWGTNPDFGPEWSYDPAKLSAPTFAIAGTGSFDAGTASDIKATEGQGIIPLWSLQNTFDAIPDDVAKIIARRAEADHSDTLTSGSGYMTAWFAYWLKGDQEAHPAFSGDRPEIAANPEWQDVKIKIGG